MKKILAIGFLMVFTMAFMVGVFATTTQAGPKPPWDAPDNCWWECQYSHWTLCCDLGGQVRCLTTVYYCA